MLPPQPGLMGMVDETLPFARDDPKRSLDWNAL